jgi:hypothetical protein
MLPPEFKARLAKELTKSINERHNNFLVLTIYSNVIIPII